MVNVIGVIALIVLVGIPIGLILTEKGPPEYDYFEDED